MSHQDLFTPSTSPESVGIPSRAILRFLDRIDGERIGMHGFLLVRHNRIAAEGYWAPWSADRKHRMYSVSKSFVSLAVGLLADEGKLSLDDPICAHFPDKLPDEVHPWLAATTVRDLLTMSTPFSDTAYTNKGPDWVRAFLSKTATHPPGSVFQYDTGGTVVLTALVERLSGQSLLDLMRPRFLDPIGFSPDAFCIRTPEGGAWGGSGVVCTLRDLSRVALACLNGGMWGNEQVLPPQYVRAATAKQIDNTLTGNCGYGYQIWREPGNGFAFCGMGSQYAVGLPDRDVLFACIADTQGAPAGSPILDVARQELYPHLSDAPLPEDADACAALADRIEGLATLPMPGSSDSPVASDIDGVWYALEDNPMGITRTRLSFDGDGGVWEYTNAQGDNALPFGLGRLQPGEFPQRNYHMEQIGTVPGTRYECLASAAWVDEATLNMEVLVTDIHLGGLRISFAFKGEEIAVFMTKQAEWFLDEYHGIAGGRRL